MTDEQADTKLAKLVKIRCPRGHWHNFLVWTEDVDKYDGAELTYCPDESDDEAPP
jgi:hypothetical protein